MQMPTHEKRRLKSEADAHRSPTLVGCAIAVRKDYFHHIGGFDDAMNVWGGENIELAFRTWMCGGQVRRGFSLLAPSVHTRVICPSVFAPTGTRGVTDFRPARAVMGEVGSCQSQLHLFFSCSSPDVQEPVAVQLSRRCQFQQHVFI